MVVRAGVAGEAEKPQPVASAGVKLVLLDIEGTTTPIAFVHEVLFPYAARALPAFLEAHAFDTAVAGDIALLAREYAAEKAAGAEGLPGWDTSSGAVAALPYLQHLMQQDRKSTALKSLQGRVWEAGYRDGALVGQLFAEVAATMADWFGAGLRIAIFSSGSVEAQKLLFRHSQAGDLTPYIAGYFDTRTGPKREAESYRRIAAAMEASPGHILFVSDIPQELDAAREAGCATALSRRPGNADCAANGHREIRRFDALAL